MMTTKKLSTLIPLSILLLGIAGPASAQSQSWFKQIPNGKARFKVLNQFNKEAVVDKETGLVWELQPSSTLFDWDSAGSRCHGLKTGGRMGWRLPSVEELGSLVDTSQNSPALPNRHPFLNFQSGEYWSATTFPLNHDNGQVTTLSRTISFAGTGIAGQQTKNTTGPFTVCVRGGKGHDGGIH